jgi:hypothetical protein
MAKGTLNITSDGIGSVDITDASISTADIADTTIVTLTCGTTNTSTTVTAASTTGMIVGAAVSGAGVPALATVVSIITNTSFVLSAAATATASVTLTFDSGITSKKLAQNLTLTGDYVTIPTATTTQRDALTAADGMFIYNSTLGVMQQRSAGDWKSVASPPTISSLDYPGSTTSVDSLGLFSDATCDYNNDPTITHDSNANMRDGMTVTGTGIPVGATIASVTSATAFELSASTTGGAVTNGTLTFNSETLIVAGTNFDAAATVTIDGTAPTTVTRNSSTQMTLTGMPPKAAQTFADGLVLTNPSGLSASINIDYSAHTKWTTASGSVGEFFDATSVGTIDLAATGDAPVTYAITSGGLPAGLSMATATGDITGTIGGSVATYNFTVTATDAEVQTALRSFSIINQGAVPTGGTLTTYTGFRVHTFLLGQSGATFTVNGALDVDYLIVAGGGAGGNWHAGGGGAGGVRVATGLTLSDTGYTITVGDGGSGGDESAGANGGNSQMSGSGITTITATGGGHGGSYTYSDPAGGGSGAGGNGTGVSPRNSRNTGAAGIDSGSAGAFGTLTYQGHDGGHGDYGHAGGGGGGAGAVGETPPSMADAGNGGDGISTFWGMSQTDTTVLLANASIGETNGSYRWIAGGGGAGIWTNESPGDGGKGTGNDSGGGRPRGSYNTNVQAPIIVYDHMGAGGSGSGGQSVNTNWAGQSTGGSGVVIIRYPA